MESLLNRYRNITVLLLVIFAQLVLIAVQVKNDQDVRMIRVWSVTAVTPLARAIEGLRGGTVGVVENYVLLKNADSENRRMRADLDRLKMENQFLKAELATADRAKALSLFQTRTPSKTLAARVIATGAGTGATSKVVFIDTGSTAGVQKGMGVVTPDGIVGKVIAAYPTASMVMLATDPDFAAGVVSQKHDVKGIIKGQGYADCKVDYVPNEEKVEVGEMFYTSGDDRIFPKGFPVGKVRVVRQGSEFKEILVEPKGLEHGAEEVLILLEGVSQAIPEVPAVANGPVYVAPPPPADPAAAKAPEPGRQVPSGTEADKLLEHYKQVGAAQGHKFGEGSPGSKPPDFNMKVPAPGAAAVPAPGVARPPATSLPGGPATGAPGAQNSASAPAANAAGAPKPPAKPANQRPAPGAASPGEPKPAPSTAAPPQ